MSRKAFLIGDPVAHSKSPLLHGLWLQELAIAGSYTAIAVKAPDLPRFFDRLREGEFVGGNVTIPHKEAALALCDAVDPAARTIGAVNTLVLQESRILGRNTDLVGFLHNLDEKAAGWDAGLETAIVLGAGGAARAVVAGLRERGVGTIAIFNRSLEKAQALVAGFGGDEVSAHPYAALADLAPAARLLVNTTAVGMGGSRFPHLPLDRLPADAVVTDIVYTPLVTPLLAEARDRGLHIVDGLGMLLYQAVPGFEAWFGKRPQVTGDLRDTVLAALEG